MMATEIMGMAVRVAVKKNLIHIAFLKEIVLFVGTNKLTFLWSNVMITTFKIMMAVLLHAR